MILSQEQLLKIASQEAPDAWIKLAREDAHKLRMHVYGEKKDEYLERLDVLESEAQFRLRVKYAPSNTATVENLFRPFDSIFSARGTYVKLGLKANSLKEKLKSQLQDVKGKLSDKSYLKDIWKYNFLTDPNGLTFLEISKDGEKAYLTSKSIDKIFSMRVYGLVPEYIRFESDVVLQGEENIKTRFWVVDDKMFYRVEKDGDNIKIIDDESFKNTLGRVPAFVNSTITDTWRKIRISPIWKQIELLDKYLQNTSAKEIFIAKHGYPIFWAYAMDTLEQSVPNVHPKDQAITAEYPKKQGRVFKKDVSDGIFPRPPRSKDDPIIAPNLAGYITPPIDGWQKMTDEQQNTFNMMYYSLWGNLPPEQVTGVTATQVNERIHATSNRLSDLADIVEKAHKQIIDLFGLFVAPASYQKTETSVNYSRRYVLESPDSIFNKYQHAKEKKVSESELDNLLVSYYQSEYATDELTLQHHLNVMKLDPFPHLTITEVLALPISEGLKNTKIFLKDFVNDTNFSEIALSELTVLKNKLKSYVDEKSEMEGVSKVSATPASPFVASNRNEEEAEGQIERAE